MDYKRKRIEMFEENFEISSKRGDSPSLFWW